MNINADYCVFTSSISDILTVKNRSLQVLAHNWRFLFESFTSICVAKYQYIILSNNLNTELKYRIFSQIFENDQSVVFKKIGQES